MVRSDIRMPGSAPQWPLTEPGRLVLDVVNGKHWRDGLLALPAAAWRIVEQVFVVSVRRHLVGDREPGGDERLAVAALSRYGDDAVEAGTGLIAATRGGGNGRAGTPTPDAIVSILTELRACGAIRRPERPPLVVTAEARAVNLARRRLTAPDSTPDARDLVLTYQDCRGTAAAMPATVPVPESVVGHRLRAIARFDAGSCAALPRCVEDDGVLAVVGHAFAVVTRCRYGSTVTDSDLARLVDRVQAGRPGVAATEVVRTAVAEALALALHDFRIARDGLPGILAAFACMVDDLGMYDCELDSLVLRSEHFAQLRGHDLTAMPTDIAPVG